MAEEQAVAKKTKRLEKKVDYDAGTVTIEVLGGSKGSQSFALSELSPEMQTKMAILGINHALGDACGGKTPAEAEEALDRKWTGYKNGEMVTRSAPGPRIPLAGFLETLKGLKPKQRKERIEQLRGLGIEISDDVLAKLDE
jgi:hypothetical protein